MMKSKITYALLGCGLLLAAIASLVVLKVLRRPIPEDRAPKVPDGFEVELVAGPPLVERPMIADFDEEGRLYIADSSGSNDKMEKQLQEKPHRIVRLEDTNGDGRFDKSVVFADSMMLPEGSMWFDGSLYVGAPPSIWKLTDTDEDGVADLREEWFQGKTVTGCANDLHGPYLGIDGWIYWSKGAFAKQTYERRGNAPFVTRAAHIFRRRPGDSWIEPVMTGGMDNPIEVVFTPEGERIFTSTFIQHPEAGRRDGILHAIYGGVYGKVHDAIDNHKRTGDVMPALTQLGPAVPCGLARYASEVFGQDYQGNLFACLFNLHKVTRNVLEPRGATFDLRSDDFLVSDNPDFHPTDVLEDADGSLLVIDTGPWYKICCPTSQLAKPDLLGAIYRIRRKGTPKIEDPRGLRLTWSRMKATDLAALLDDPRPVVRSRAIHELSKRESEVIPGLAELLRTSNSAEARRNAVWTLTRIRGAAAREAVRTALEDKEESIRHAAAHSVSVWRDSTAFPQLLNLLKKDSPSLQRVASEALGRLGNKNAVPVLLDQSANQNDRILEHSLTYALIEIADRAGTALGLQAASSRTQRAVLIALDQMDGGGLKPQSITPLLASGDSLLRQTASWIASHHPEWGPALAEFFGRRLSDPSLNALDREELQQQLPSFAKSEAIQTLLAKTVSSSGSKQARLLALQAMENAPLREIPENWCTALATIMAQEDVNLITAAVSTVRTLPMPKGGAPALNTALVRVGRNSTLPPEVRLDAMASVPEGLKNVEQELFEFLVANVYPSQPVAVRSAAAKVLSKARLTHHQLLILTDLLRTVGPLELPTLLSAYENATDQDLGFKLINALKGSKGLMSLRGDLLKSCLAKFPASAQQQAEALLASLDIDVTKQTAHLDQLLVSLKGGDVRRGQGVFNSTKAACSACHTIGYLGGKAGPDLTKIGQVRTERDLLESIIYPSASFVRSYEPVVVVTQSGEIHNGVVREDGSTEILLATGPRSEVRIARVEIREMRPGAVSVMPAGLEEQLTYQELADLMAFLRQTQWGAQ